MGYTSRAMEPNSHLHISYSPAISDEKNTKKRQDELRDAWGFTCNCEKCASPRKITKRNQQLAAKLNIFKLEKAIEDHGFKRWTPQYGAWVEEYTSRIRGLP